MLTIGQVARAADVSIETVRYYQRRGLLQEPEKALHGQRRYEQGDVNRLLFIRRAQMLGFAREEIKKLLYLDSADCCDKTHDMAVSKLALINAKIADLTNMRNALSDFIQQGEVGNQQSVCPIIRALVQSQKACLL